LQEQNRLFAVEQGRCPVSGGDSPWRELAEGRSPTLPKDPIEEMAAAFFDPIIVYPGGGWEETIPERLKAEVPLRRLAHIQRCVDGKAAWDEACDLEALVYLYPATLAFPMDEQWTRIYLYLGTQCYGDRFPEDIRQERLSDYDLEELRGLKRWIYERRVKARKDRRRADRAEERQAVAAEYEQLAMQL